MHSAAVFVGVFISFCLRRVAAVDSRRPNFTATSATGKSAKNTSDTIGIELKDVDDEPIVADDDTTVEVEGEVAEGFKTTHKWETGIVVAIITLVFILRAFSQHCALYSYVWFLMDRVCACA